jgi:hypothetical protein
MVHPTCEQKPNDLSKVAGTDGQPLPKTPYRPLPKEGQGDDSVAEQQIADMISEGCPNTQGY